MKYNKEFEEVLKDLDIVFKYNYMVKTDSYKTLPFPVMYNNFLEEYNEVKEIAESINQVGVSISSDMVKRKMYRELLDLIITSLIICRNVKERHFNK